MSDDFDMKRSEYLSRRYCFNIKDRSLWKPAVWDNENYRWVGPRSITYAQIEGDFVTVEKSIYHGNKGADCGSGGSYPHKIKIHADGIHVDVSKWLNGKDFAKWMKVWLIDRSKFQVEMARRRKLWEDVSDARHAREQLKRVSEDNGCSGFAIGMRGK